MKIYLTCDFNLKNESNSMQIDIAGKVREKKLASNKALLPLFEALVNSIHSVEEESTTKPGIIEIQVERVKQESLELKEGSQEITDKPQIIGFKIVDNGIGFTEDNWQSFNFAHSSYKLNKGGKGIGRITWLRAFDSVNINSTYRNNGSFYNRTFDFKRTRDGIENPLNQIIEKDNPSRRTVVHLKNLNERFQKWTNNDLEDIAMKIIEHCFSFFREDDCPRILLTDEDDSIVVNDYFKKYTRDTIDKFSKKIKGKNFDFEVVKMYSSRPDNKIHYRAHRREVMNEKITDYIPELKSLILDENGDKFSLAVYVSSDYLDEKVNEERTEIAFSTSDVFFS